MRWSQRGISPRRAALVGFLLLAIVSYFVFTKSLPFRHHFTLHAIVDDANLLEPGSAVRIGGVDAGTVTGTRQDGRTDLTVVDMRIDHPEGIRQNATIWIRPRLFLEGNFYIDLSPGTPAAGPMPDGGTIPLARTTTPVQLDQVLDTFPAGIRANLQSALAGLGLALDAPPTTVEAAALAPADRGLSGGAAINRTFTTSPAALRDSAIATEALTGPDGTALARIVAGLGRAATGLDRANAQLGPLVVDLDATLRAAASEQTGLRETVTQLGPFAAHARIGFAALSGAFGPTATVANELSSAAGQIPATSSAALPWLAQANPLFSRPELLGLLRSLAPASGNLAALTNAMVRFLPQLNAFDECATRVLIPTANTVVDDGALSSGERSYQEFLSALAGLSGASQGEDGNGPFLGVGASGGPFTVESGQTNYLGEDDTGFASMAAAPLRTRPAYTNVIPPIDRSSACASQQVPDVNGPGSSGAADGSDPNGPAPARPNDPSEDER